MIKSNRTAAIDRLIKNLAMDISNRRVASDSIRRVARAARDQLSAEQIQELIEQLLNGDDDSEDETPIAPASVRQPPQRQPRQSQDQPPQLTRASRPALPICNKRDMARDIAFDERMPFAERQRAKLFQALRRPYPNPNICNDPGFRRRWPEAARVKVLP